jgi:hypothetical protein
MTAESPSRFPYERQTVPNALCVCVCVCVCASLCSSGLLARSNAQLLLSAANDSPSLSLCLCLCHCVCVCLSLSPFFVSLPLDGHLWQPFLAASQSAQLERQSAWLHWQSLWQSCLCVSLRLWPSSRARSLPPSSLSLHLRLCLSLDRSRMSDRIAFRAFRVGCHSRSRRGPCWAAARAAATAAGRWRIRTPSPATRGICVGL